MNRALELEDSLRPGQWAADRGPGQTRRRWVWAISASLVVLVGLVFGQTLGHRFVGYDDQAFVYKNPHVNAGLTLDGLWWALTDGTFHEWTPLSSLSHMLDCQLYGTEPLGHFLTNVLLHAASAVLLFLVLLRMTDELWPSAWVAAIFAIHPLHVESVAWLAERRDVLSGLFFMLTLGAYVRYVEKPLLGRYLAVAGSLTLGLMSKPILVTVPCLLLLLDYWPLNRFRVGPPLGSRTRLGQIPTTLRLLVEKVSLLALATASVLITVSSHESMAPASSLERLSLWSRLANALISYAAYLGQAFYPVGMVPHYPHPGSSVSNGWAVGSLILLVAITAVALVFWRSRPYLIVGWLWYLGMLVPVIGVVGYFVYARADRYTYLSQIGLSIALAWLVWRGYQARQARESARWRQVLLATVSGTAVLVLAAVAWHQTRCWRDAEALWTHTLACTPHNRIAHSNLAGVLLDQGRIEEGIENLRLALTDHLVNPELQAVHHLVLADVLFEHGYFDEALEHYEQTVRLFPAGERGHTQFALALAAAGRFDEAIDQWRAAAMLDPTHWQLRIGVAKALLDAGRPDEAIAECRQVLAEQPGAIEVIVTLGTALAAQGKTEEAIGIFERALQLDRGRAEVHFRLGLILNDRGQSEVALAHLKTAVRLEPTNLDVVEQTAWFLATSPDPALRDGARALELAQAGLKLAGERNPHALDVLGAALAEAGQFAEAAAAAWQASVLALEGDDAALSGAIVERVHLYRQNLPFHEPAASPRGAQ